VASGFSYIESPRWRDGRIWLSDFYTHQVIAVDPASGRVEVICEVNAQPSGIGWLPDDTMLVVSMLDRRLLRWVDGTLIEHADLSGHIRWPANDMVVDAAGRAWVGNFGYDLMANADPQPTDLLCVHPDGSIVAAAGGLLFPNGTVIDDTTLVVAETVGRRLTAFTVADDGTLTDRRHWADFNAAGVRSETGRPILPDGISFDAEGCIWVADALSGRVLRVAEGGIVIEEIAVGTGTFACMLGGTEGTTLFICAAPSYLESERRTTREGRLLAVEVDVPRAGLP
jgi:sugar lactone lactonase YvrE